MISNKQEDQPPELRAVSAIYSALKELDPPVQLRAIRYAAEMLGLSLGEHEKGRSSQHDGDSASAGRNENNSQAETSTVLPPVQGGEDPDGINPVALKWLKRSGIEAPKMQSLFSLGIDEIDLVATKVPGGSKRERLRNVILLKGIAAYLSTGTPRISSEQLKEASLHYNAYDGTNHATYLKSFAADVGGTKESGYTLNPRGLTAATELVKKMLSSKE